MQTSPDLYPQLVLYVGFHDWVDIACLGEDRDFTGVIADGQGILYFQCTRAEA